MCYNTATMETSPTKPPTKLVNILTIAGLLGGLIYLAEKIIKWIV